MEEDDRIALRAGFGFGIGLKDLVRKLEAEHSGG